MRQDLQYNFIVKYRDGTSARQFQPCKLGCDRFPCPDCKELAWKDINKPNVEFFMLHDASWDIHNKQQQPEKVRLVVWVPPTAKLIYRRINVSSPGGGSQIVWMVGCQKTEDIAGQKVNKQQVSLLFEDGHVEVADHFVETYEDDKGREIKKDPTDILPHWFFPVKIRPWENEEWDGLPVSEKNEITP